MDTGGEVENTILNHTFAILFQSTNRFLGCPLLSKCNRFHRSTGVKRRVQRQPVESLRQLELVVRLELAGMLVPVVRLEPAGKLVLVGRHIQQD